MYMQYQLLRLNTLKMVVFLTRFILFCSKAVCIYYLPPSLQFLFSLLQGTCHIPKVFRVHPSVLQLRGSHPIRGRRIGD